MHCTIEIKSRKLTLEETLWDMDKKPQGTKDVVPVLFETCILRTYASRLKLGPALHRLDTFLQRKPK